VPGGERSATTGSGGARALGRWIRPHFRRSRPEAQAASLARDDVHPVTAILPEDIVVAGYPKSGNTWMQHLLAGAVFGLDIRLAPETLVQDLVVDVHFRRFFRRLRTPMFFKSHFLPKPEYRRVVYLVRDGRDVMVSYLHHRRAMSGRDIDFLEFVRSDDLFPARWHEHVDAWAANPYGAEMITVRYEDLHTAPAEQVESILRFAGLQRDPSVVRWAVQNATFESMRDLASRVEVRHNPAWPEDEPFFRRGEVGSYRDEMPAAVLAAFLEQAGPTLARLGYKATDSDPG
jgi:hypothetical protein